MTVNKERIFAQLFWDVTVNTDINDRVFRSYCVLVGLNEQDEFSKHKKGKINTVRCSAADLAEYLGTKWGYAKRYLDTMVEWNMISPVEEYGRKKISLWSFNEIDDFEIPSKKDKNIK